ncbi:MAG: hypothetical protein ABIH76_08180 [Candidatus Bathyarchaeota archaeon]
MSNETCYHCKETLTDVAAFLTANTFAVCDKCLPLLCDEYDWESRDFELHKLSLKNLKPLHVPTEEEISWELRNQLSFIPLVIEKVTELSEGSHFRLRIPELLETPTLNI